MHRRHPHAELVVASHVTSTSELACFQEGVAVTNTLRFSYLVSMLNGRER
jgi:hypothetical protein